MSLLPTRPPDAGPSQSRTAALHQHLLDFLAGPATAAHSLPQSLTPADWEELATMAERHGLQPLLYARLSAHAPEPTAPEPVMRRLRGAFLINGAKNTLLYQELGSVLAALESAGIPVIVLKGAHLAATVYDRIALRTMNDIDLLVPPDDLERAALTLRQRGYVARHAVGNITDWRRQYHHLPRMFKPPGAGIELHWAILPPARLPGSLTAGLWERSQQTVIGGASTRVLSPEDLLLHLVLHTAWDGSGPFRLGLKPLCDLAAIIRRYQNTLDWDRLLVHAAEWRAAKSLYVALWLAREWLRAEIPDPILARARPGDFAECWAAAAADQVRWRGVPKTALDIPQVLALCRTLGRRSMGERLAYLLRATVPPRQQMVHYMAYGHNTSVKGWGHYTCYLRRAADWLRRGALLVRECLLRRRETIATCAQLRREARFWQWLATPTTTEPLSPTSGANKAGG